MKINNPAYWRREAEAEVEVEVEGMRRSLARVTCRRRGATFSRHLARSLQCAAPITRGDVSLVGIQNPGDLEYRSRTHAWADCERAGDLRQRVLSPTRDRVTE